MGTPADYLDASLALTRGDDAAPGDAIAPGARVTRSVVWPGATVGEHAVLDECIVTDVHVPAGFQARRSVLIPAHLRRDGDTATEVAGMLVFPIDR